MLVRQCKFDTVNYVLQDLAVDRSEFGMVSLPLRQIGLLGVPSHGNLGGVVLELSVVDQAVVDQAVIDQAVVNEAAGFERGF